MDMVPDTCLTHVAMCPLITLLPNELQGSVRGQNGVELCQESSGHGPRHVTCVDMCPKETLLPDELDIVLFISQVCTTYLISVFQVLF